MRVFFLNIMAVFLPWLALLIVEGFSAGLIALGMQATVIGWIPATMWAWRVVQEHHYRQHGLMKEKNKEKRARKTVSNTKQSDPS